MIKDEIENQREIRVVESRKSIQIIIFIIILSIIGIFRILGEEIVDYPSLINITGFIDQISSGYGGNKSFSVKDFEFRCGRYDLCEVNIGDYVRAKGKQLEVNDVRNSKIYYINDVEILASLDAKKNEIGLLRYLWLKINNVVYRFRDRLNVRIARLLVGEEKAMFNGIVLGDKSGIDKDMHNDLQESGLLHVVVASGSNVALIASIVFGLLNKYLRKNVSSLLGIVCIWGYVVLVGMDIPIVRAGLMMSFVLICKMFGRKIDSLWMLMLIGFIFICLDPLIVNNLSFQLSFLATTGLVMLGSPILNLLDKAIEKLGLCSENVAVRVINVGLSQTIAAQVMVVPVIAQINNSWNVSSIIANVMVGPFVSSILLLGVVACFLMLWSEMVASFIIVFERMLIDFVLFVNTFFSGLTMFEIDVVLSGLLTFLWYVLVVVIYFLCIRNEKNDVEV